MLPARIAAWLRPAPNPPEPYAGRQAYHSDIRALRPRAWSTHAPSARGLEVERAMWLAGVTSADFAAAVDVTLTPHRVTPVDDIVALCHRRADQCGRRAKALKAELPPPNPYGRPALPWHRATMRQASALDRAAAAWEGLANVLLNNRWDG